MENPHESDVFDEWSSVIENVKISISVDRYRKKFIYTYLVSVIKSFLLQKV